MSPLSNALKYLGFSLEACLAFNLSKSKPDDFWSKAPFCVQFIPHCLLVCLPRGSVTAAPSDPSSFHYWITTLAGVAWSWMRSQLYWFTSQRPDLKTLQWRFQQVCEKHYWWKVLNAIESWLWKYIIASLEWMTCILLFNWSSTFVCLIHFSQWSHGARVDLLWIAVTMNNFIFSVYNANNLSCLRCIWKKYYVWR